MAPALVASVNFQDNMKPSVQTKPAKSWADVVRRTHEETSKSDKQQEKLLALMQLKGKPNQYEDNKVTSDDEETTADMVSASSGDSDTESPMSPTLSETSLPLSSPVRLPSEAHQAPEAQRRSSLRSNASLFVPGALSQHTEVTFMPMPSPFQVIRPPPGLDPPPSVSAPPALRTPLRATASQFVPAAAQDQCI